MVDFNEYGDLNEDFNNKEMESNYSSSHCFEFDEHECNPRWPHSVVIYREELSDNPWDDGEHTVVLYKGACRSYKKSLTSFKDTILTNVRMLSIKGLIKGLKTNDRIKVSKYGYVEEGYLKDASPYMKGRGMTIEWDYDRV